MLSEYRPIWVYADENEIATDLRVRVKGRSNLTLLPDFYTVEIYNISATDESYLRNARTITVKVDRESIVCTGIIEGIYTHEERANTVTTVSVSDGGDFWQKTVNISIGKGASVFDVIRTIVDGSATIGVFLCEDIRMPRGQVCSGRVAEIVETFARSLHARAYITENVLNLVSKGSVTNTFNLNAEDTIGSLDTMDGVYVLKIKGRSFSVGDYIGYQGKNMRIIARAVSLDSQEGDWDIEISMVEDSMFTIEEMEGGW